MQKPLIALTAGAFLLAACTTQDPYTGEEKTSHTTRGAVIGAVAGGVIGALTNTSSGNQAAKNALIGAGIGALAGAAVGNYMDRQEAELRERLRDAGVSVVRQGDNILLVMESDITFDLGSARVKPEFYETIAAVGEVLHEYEQTIVEVSGFTDTTGSHDFNQVLSEDRAEAVADILIDEGVIPERLIVQGFGETELKIETGDNVKEPRNRRVEIQISPFTS